ncbi:MAG TPA: hypothetical protein PLL89_01760 [bacterium]|jgi:septal ring factor EnvC (AmiA/AmiB activator)|nr:hypothetical protein [bacterium]HON05099.1 hypothetical protein [bacterium]HOQ81768.1 hypothetical protein [bacterium]
MKYLTTFMVACTLLFGYTMALNAQEKPGQPAPSQEEMAAKKKQIGEIQGKMRAIEKQVASQDEECKKIATQMQELEKQRRARLDTLLEKNQEYQTLKKQLLELMPPPPPKKEAPKK